MGGKRLLEIEEENTIVKIFEDKMMLHYFPTQFDAVEIVKDLIKKINHATMSHKKSIFNENMLIKKGFGLAQDRTQHLGIRRSVNQGMIVTTCQGIFGMLMRLV
ncbi:MAG: hypothetical protein EZS28_022643 [Streblomastix strix]|uniref:Uncharacterized protein n=1 Tax=Streblomastix strix TaxID=222440 RepID=A0A5J4VH26_9EUKA|nr:MAG: hypothetical protein EZS28_022643 [Streblomastix strix]